MAGLLRTDMIEKIRRRINDPNGPGDDPTYSDEIISDGIDTAAQFLTSYVQNYHPNYYLTIYEMLADTRLDQNGDPDPNGEYFEFPSDFKTGCAVFQKLTPDESNSVRYRLVKVNGWDHEFYRFYWGNLIIYSGVTGWGTFSYKYTADGTPLVRILPVPDEDFVYDIYYLRAPVDGSTYVDIPFDWSEACVLKACVQVLSTAMDQRVQLYESHFANEMQAKANENARQRSLQMGTLGWGRSARYGYGSVFGANAM